MSKVIHVMTKIIEWLLILLWIVMVTVIFSQVIARYIFDKSIYWAEELGIYTMIWSCFLGTALATRHKAHTRVSFFVNLLPPVGQVYMEIFVNLLCTAWLCVVSWYGYKVSVTGFRNISTALQLPLGFVYIALPISGILMVIYYLVFSVESIQKLRSDRRKDGELP